LFTCVTYNFRCWLIPEWYDPHQQQHCDHDKYWNWCCSSGLHYYLCTSANPETQWYFPNGNPVPNNPALPYQRNRDSFPGRVILNRNSESTITGIFHRHIPDASGVIQSLYVGIYTSTTGESCILCVFAWLFARKYLALQSRTVYTFQVLVYIYPSTAYHHIKHSTLVVLYTMCQRRDKYEQHTQKQIQSLLVVTCTSQQRGILTFHHSQA